VKIKSYAKTTAAVVSLGLITIFIFRQMFPSNNLEYRFVRTEQAVVTSNVGPGSVARSRTPSVMVKTESGLIVRVMHPTQDSYIKGEVIKVDLYTAKGRKPVYRLSQKVNDP